MPNRIIRESIRKSGSIDGLTWFEEVFFYRLITACDDFGRYDARPKILKADLFPLKDGVTLRQISDALHRLSTAGMVQVYEYDQKPFLQLTAWTRHQQVRNKKSKFPAPGGEGGGLPPFDINCGQSQADVPDIQSVSESESEAGEEGGERARTSGEEVMAGVMDCFSQDIKPPSRTDLEILADWTDRAGPELVRMAISEAARSGARNVRYVEKVLINWSDAGVKTPEQARAAIRDFGERKKARSARPAEQSKAGGGNVFADMLREELGR